MYSESPTGVVYSMEEGCFTAVKFGIDRGKKNP